MLGPVPLWMVALVVAGLAPLVVRALVARLQAAAMRRTERVLRSAQQPPPGPHDEEQSGPSPH